MQSPLQTTPLALFRDSAAELKRLPSVAIAALLLGLNLILGSFRIDIMPGLHLGFGFLTQALTGMLFGPVVAVITGVLGDELGFFLRPDGPWFPIYAVTAIAGGLIYGLAFYHRPIKLPRVILTKCVVTVICNLFLNTLWDSMLFGSSFAVLLPARFIKNIAMLPIEIALLFAVCKAVPAIYQQATGKRLAGSA